MDQVGFEYSHVDDRRPVALLASELLQALVTDVFHQDISDEGVVVDLIVRHSGHLMGCKSVEVCHRHGDIVYKD